MLHCCTLSKLCFREAVAGRQGMKRAQAAPSGRAFWGQALTLQPLCLHSLTVAGIMRTHRDFVSLGIVQALQAMDKAE